MKPAAVPGRLASSLLVAAVAAAALAACDARRPSETSAARTETASSPSAVRSGWPFAAAGVDAAAKQAPTAVETTKLTRRNYVIVFDASGSMLRSQCAGTSTKIEVAKRALVGFVARLPADANVGLQVFDNDGPRQLLPLGELDKDRLQREVAGVVAGGGTPLAEAIGAAYDELTAQARRQSGYGEYHLVVVTDGEATGADPRTVVDRIVRDSPVLINTIGFCIDEQHSLNQPGRTLYRSADNPQALEQNLAEVLAEAPNFDPKRFDGAK